MISCDQSLTAIAKDDAATIGNGLPVSNEQLAPFNTRISDAVSTLNTTMATNPNWVPLLYKMMTPTLYGSVKFQVMQLESEAYVNAMK